MPRKRPASTARPRARAGTTAGPTASRGERRPAARPRPGGPRAPRRAALRGTALAHQAREILERLRGEYPDARTELDYHGPFQLLVATILSAQTTDVRVNMVTPALFARYPDAAALAAANPAELEQMIRSTGFFRAKSRSLIGMAAALVERYGGQVPGVMDELVALPGVGRKTANVVLGNAFHRNEGVVVDTHVGRLTIRLGLTAETDPIKVEQVLMRVIPREDWALISHLLIFHGRRVCTARKPACGRCVLADICPSAFSV